MNITLLNASKGTSKNGHSWLRVSYAVGDFNGASDRCGLRLAYSFVPEEHQGKVWDFLKAVKQFPSPAVVEISTSNGKTIELVGISAGKSS